MDVPNPNGVSRHLNALAARGHMRGFRRNVLILQEGEQGDALYIVVSGRVRVFASDSSGREMTLAVCGPWEYVGEMALDGGYRSANVETLEATRCAVIPRATLLSYIADEPEFALEMLARLIRRARVTTENARNIALIDVYGRLTKFLNQLAGPASNDGSKALAERITHQAIAGHLACSREMVSRLLKDLERGGYIRIDEDRRIVLQKALPSRW
ncbi:MAG TPA: Crp/Fnr family transcriptional regulator [Burkholderiaceae bacterium]|nr:Crp/Fnr family transcriptional regulator [Burkholderiaceae bacterium]